MQVFTNFGFDNRSKLDQFKFVVKYCTSEGIIHDRLLYTGETADSTKNSTLVLFCNIYDCYSLNWKKKLVGQAFDRAQSMQGAIKGLQTAKMTTQMHYMFSALHIAFILLSVILAKLNSGTRFLWNSRQCDYFFRSQKKNCHLR